MAFVSQEKLFTKRWFIAYSYILIGTFIMAISFVFFVSPHKLAPGGVYGIAIVLHHLFGFPIGTTALCMDIPLAIIGVKVLGPRFGIKTVVGFVSTAIFTDFLSYIWGNQPLASGDPLLSAIFGGVLLGIGLGLLFRSRATSGGSDIIAMIIAKYTRLPLGELLVYVDSAIVLVSLVAFQDWKIPLCSLITIYITGKVIDTVLQGMSYEKSVFIISDKYSEIRERILTELGRGGTIFTGKGMYNDASKSMIFTVLTRREVELLKDHIREIDSQAFVTVMDANEILGKGFKSLNDGISE